MYVNKKLQVGVALWEMLTVANLLQNTEQCYLTLKVI